jgi:hypothetical protein
MNNEYQRWRTSLERLDRALTALMGEAEPLDVARAAGRGWYDLLRNKLIPQAAARPMLVVAIVGGTNIGKSVVFNQLAGEMASGVSPLAAGTRHPVCMVPASFYDPPTLQTIFPGFALRAWQSSDDPLNTSEEPLLFWREGTNVPERLLLLDTPDIDSDARVNWQKAETIRESADVLIAVLTQQKYNDAAVKQFFRKAAEADKAVIVLFNQCDLVEDRSYWPQWLATFAHETGIRPELVYAVPYDRAAAKDLRLPFYDIGIDGRSSPGEPADLRAELASLHFDEIKIRTFRGALAEVLDEQTGAASWLAEVRSASRRFESAGEALSAASIARVRWPAVPAPILVDEIGRWWNEHRPTWSRTIHGFYRAVGTGVTWPVRAAWRRMHGPQVDAIDAFRAAERATVIQTIESMLDELERLSQIGNEILRPRLQAILGGAARSRLLSSAEAAHRELPALDDNYRAFLNSELDAWKVDNPRAVWWLQSLDHVAAIARPAVTVTLAVSGGIFAGDVVHQAAMQAAGHTAAQVAAEAAITSSVTASGEAALAATSDKIKQAAARLFHRLQDRYADQRAAWLASWIEHELLDDLLTELRRGAGVAHGQAFREATEALEALAANRH